MNAGDAIYLAECWRYLKMRERSRTLTAQEADDLLWIEDTIEAETGAKAPTCDPRAPEEFA